MGEVAQAFLPVRVCLAGKTLSEQFEACEGSSEMNWCLRRHSQEWLCHKVINHICETVSILVRHPPMHK